MLSRRRKYERPAEITVTVPGWLRCWVSEALFDAVKTHNQTEELERHRHHARRPNVKPPPSIADGIRDLAAQISP